VKYVGLKKKLTKKITFVVFMRIFVVFAPSAENLFKIAALKEDYAPVILKGVVQLIV
jgi:hypothetical protein